jgi:hypothetical protein
LGIFLNEAVVATALGYIIISRNHYGVDVFFEWLVPEAISQIYQLAKNVAQKKMAVLRFICWIETRKFPLTTGTNSSERAE